MFGLGSKIILVSSSVEKSAGPRRGSVGFFCQSRSSRVFLNHSICASYSDVVFVKYGFEKKHRLEKKQVINIFPIIRRELGEDIEQQVINTATKIAGKNSDAGAQSTIRAYFDAPPTTPIVMATPYGCYGNLLEGNRTEARGWVEAILSNQSFALFVHHALNSRHYTRSSMSLLQHSLTWEAVRTMIMDRDYRKSRLDLYSKEPKLLLQTIQILRSMVVMMERKPISTFANNVYGSFMGMNLHKPIDAERAYHLIMENIFNTVVRDILVELAASTSSSSLLKFLEDIKSVSGVLGVLSARLGVGV